MDLSGDLKAMLPTPSGAPYPLLLGWRDFRRSGVPARLLCFEGGSWAEVAAEVVAPLRRAFADGRAVVEAVVGGSGFLFDFLQMVRVDEATGEACPLGWIDERGARFFPAPAGGAKRKREEEEEEDEATSSAVDEASQGAAESDKKRARGRWGKAERLGEANRFHQVVKKLFLGGMGPASGATITAVHKCAHGHGEARLRAFQLQGQLVAAARGGRGNVKFAWYGALAGDVTAAVEHGFGRTNSALLGALAHGDGVHLSPPQCPYPSAMLAKVDERGEGHIVLCRVVMGQPEAVPARSSQFHPSSDDYDSGVDNILNPRWYIMWSTHMNTRILPEYVVSFKFPNLQRQGSGLSMELKKPSRPSNGDMFPKLFAEIQRCLPSSSVQTLERSYNSFKKGEIRKENFIRFLRTFIGDKLLATAAKKIRGY